MQARGPSGAELRQLGSLIHKCFRIVCAERSCLLNEKQAINGLKLCIDRLDPIIPRQPNEWYCTVFNNFDLDRDGRIDFESFYTIIMQLYQHYVNWSGENSEADGTYASYECSSVGDSSCDGTEDEIPSSSPVHACSNVSIASSPEWKRIEMIYRPGDNEMISQIMFPSYYRFDKIFEDYCFEEVSGVGSFGRVQVVRHIATGQRRAAKVIFFQEEAHLSIIMKEVAMMKSLDHPNIIHLAGVYYDRLTIYLILELCEGGNLFSRIIDNKAGSKSRLTERQVCEWLHQIISACAYCHKMGLVHRDVKPENILFLDNAPDSRLKLIDFGLSERMSLLLDDMSSPPEKRGPLLKFFSLFKNKNKMTGKLMQRAGTPNYMAPEMIRGCYDQKCDVFAVGIVMHQLLSGIHPFFIPGVDTVESVKRKILEVEPDFSIPELNCVSASGIALLRQLLCKSPKKRISASAALECPWFKEVLGIGTKEQHLTSSVLEGLAVWNTHNCLKQGVMKVLAQQVSVTKMTGLQQKFKAIDVKGKGYISVVELKEALISSGYSMESPYLMALLKSLSNRGTDSISYNHFISSLIANTGNFDESEVYYIFSLLDPSSKGYITLEDLKMTLANTFAKSDLSEQEIRRVFNDMDTNKDGKVIFSEFYNMLTLK